MLEQGKTIEVVPQGGKTDAARGQVKKLWQRREKQQKAVSSDNDYDDEREERKFYAEKAAKNPFLRLVA